MRFIICYFLIGIIQSSSSAQIVNVESHRLQKDTTGWFGNFGTRFQFEKNAVEVININLTAYVEHQTAKGVYLFFANYNLLKGNNRSLYDNTFYHLRYNYKINPWLHLEAFTQLQRNDITGIGLRRLVGIGPRFKLVGGKKFILHAATAAMYEYEREKTIPIIYHNEIRSSSYVSLNYTPSAYTELSGTIFYQPLFSDYHNYRVLNEITAKFRIIKHLSFKIIWYYLHDSNPAAGTPKFNYSIINEIEYSF